MACEVLRTEIRPDAQFPMVVGQHVQVLRPLASGDRVAMAGPGQCGIEIIFGLLEGRVRDPEMLIRL